METFNNIMDGFNSFLNVGSSLYDTVADYALQAYQLDTLSKMGTLKVDALFEAADSAVQQAQMQQKAYEIERKASEVQAFQTYQQRMAEYSEALEYNNFVTESRLGGGESMSVRKFLQKQAETVAQDADRINSQAILVDSTLRMQGHMSMLSGLYNAKALRNQALNTAYQNTIDMMEVLPNPLESVKTVTTGIQKIANIAYEGFKSK